MEALQKSNTEYLKDLITSTATLTKANNLMEAIKTPSLKTIALEIGKSRCHSLLIKILDEMNILNGNQVLKDDIALYAYHIKERLPELKIGELIYTLAKGVNGGYGKIYGKVNYTLICEWLDKSFNEYHNMKHNEHLDKKNADSSYREAAEKPKHISELHIKTEIDKLKK